MSAVNGDVLIHLRHNWDNMLRSLSPLLVLPLHSSTSPIPTHTAKPTLIPGKLECLKKST